MIFSARQQGLLTQDQAVIDTHGSDFAGRILPAFSWVFVTWSMLGMRKMNIPLVACIRTNLAATWEAGPRSLDPCS